MDQENENAALCAEIQRVVDETVRPVLRSHGGDITLTALAEHVLHFRLSGSCSGCPSSWLTAEELVRGPLMERFPMLRDVVADTDVDEELIELARAVLSGAYPPGNPD